MALPAVLKTLQKQLEKKFSKKLFHEGPPQEDVAGLPTGALSFDVATGCKGGGIPIGRITEVFGNSSMGKTTFALMTIKSWYDHRDLLEQSERVAAYIDVERTTTKKSVSSMGIPINEILWSTPDSAEEAFQIVLDLAASGAVGIIVLDSIDACVSQRVLDKAVGDNDVGGVTKQLNNLVRQLSKVATETNTTVIFINQVRLNPNAGMYGNPNVTPGGKAVKFYSSLQVEVMDKGKTDTKNAFQMRLKIRKNKMTPPIDDVIEFDCFYMKGPDPISDTIETAKTMGLAKFAGQAFKVSDGTEFKSISSGGKEGVRHFYMENPEELQKLKELCLAKASENYITLSTQNAEEEDQELEEDLNNDSETA